MKIYLASSWRNHYQPQVVALLRDNGFEVYDFKNPSENEKGFAWSEIDPDWSDWTPEQYRKALTHPLAKKGFSLDFNAMKACDTCVLLLPSGRSASFELGWCLGAGKRAIVYMPQACEPELMYMDCEIVTTKRELLDSLKGTGVKDEDPVS